MHYSDECGTNNMYLSDELSCAKRERNILSEVDATNISIECDRQDDL